MTHGSNLEARVAALISAMADSSPTDVDPLAMARLAATSRVGLTTRFGFMPGRLAFALLLLALASAIAGGALVAGRFLQRDAADTLTARAFVEPFDGLPAEGAVPSAPETGELVVAFGGRVSMLGGDFHRMWLYADGRLIWRSNLEGRDVGLHIWAERFGGIEPTTAVIEQRLTSEGVELIRADVMASARVLGPVKIGEDTTTWSRPGVIWGGLTLGDGDRLLDADWFDSRLPTRLASPGSWLPESAWEDRRIGGYVPSRYAVCLDAGRDTGSIPSERSALIELLPAATWDLIRTRALDVKSPASQADARCRFQVTTDDARMVLATLEASTFRPEASGLRFRVPIGRSPSAPEGFVELLPVLPDGDVVCNCG